MSSGSTGDEAELFINSLTAFHQVNAHVQKKRRQNINQAAVSPGQSSLNRVSLSVRPTLQTD